MDQTYYETLCAITLVRVMGYEPAAARRLISTFGSPGAVFSQSPSALDEAFGPFCKYRASICEQELELSAKEFEALARDGCSFVYTGGPGYPPLLEECPDAPVGLYVRAGSPPEEVFAPCRAISIVGTRDISPYGKEWTEKIVASISRSPAKPLIVSGLAIGVDVTAHAAALECGLPTVGVIPVGIDSVYPLRHRGIAELMAATPGCALVTDFPPGTSPVAFNFLRRNRIIAGLSHATILAESKAKGGGTMTARLAAGYGREVFCLPGRIDDVRSAGCNLLIREQLAEPITSPDGIAAQLGLGSTRKTVAALEDIIRASYSGAGDLICKQLTAIALFIRKNRGATPDEICRATGIPYGDVSAACSLLESDGFINMDLLQRCTIDGKKAYLCG